jgi:hypothetical protein
VEHFNSPIQIAVNTRRLLMDGHKGFLEFELRNLVDDEDFDAQFRVSSDAFPSLKQPHVKLRAGKQVRRRVPLDLTGPERCAGEVAFEIELLIVAGEARHRFCGEFSMVVLDHARDMREVTVNIGKVVEQSGKAGMGSVNEIDFSNLINLPRQATVNDFLTEQREPRFVAIDLEYEGSIPDHASPVASRSAPPLSRCALIAEHQSEPRTLILTGRSLVVGRSRAEADIVAWVMPRTDENDTRTRSISGRHCRFGIDAEGVFIEQLSRVNLTRVDGISIQRRFMLRSGQSYRLQLSNAIEFQASSLAIAITDAVCSVMADPALEASCASQLKDSARHEIGGVILERTDGLPERYLWLISSVHLPCLAPSNPVHLLAVPHIALDGESGESPRLLPCSEVGSGCIVPIAVGDTMATPTGRISVVPYAQDCGASLP